MGDTESVAGGFRPLDPRVVRADRLTWWLGLGAYTVVMAVMCAMLVITARTPPWFERLAIAIAVALAVVQVVFAIVWPPLAYRHCTFRIDEQGIEIRRGVLVRRVINVPRSRVQHTDVTQGPVERRFGLGTLVVFTAGTFHAMVDLRGLDYDIALWARDSLLPRGARDHADAV